MAWIMDPTAWLGLGTLVLLEIVLGIDNLIFIAILTDRLPLQERNRARLTGLSLALLTRLGLLAGMSWLQTLTTPLFTVRGFGFSPRDIVLIVGGLFLLFKGTTELHSRLEAAPAIPDKMATRAVFWQVIIQIVVLDAVFSLDSVITAVGMVDELMVMMIAVVIAVGVMMWTSGPLMNFVSAHATVVILCLSFLLMIGFGLVLDGFGFHVPKGYLYAAIGFSVAVEAFNQIARRNRTRYAVAGNLHARTADAVLRILGGGGQTKVPVVDDVASLMAARNTAGIFGPDERFMMAGVLSLAERSVPSIMTASNEVAWLDLDAEPEKLRREILETGHEAYPVCRGNLDNLVGVARAPDLVRDLLENSCIDPSTLEQKPLIVHESESVLRVIERIRRASVR